MRNTKYAGKRNVEIIDWYQQNNWCCFMTTSSKPAAVALACRIKTLSENPRKYIQPAKIVLSINPL